RRHTRSKRDWSSDVCSSDLWEAAYQAWRADNPQRAELYDRLVAQELPENFDTAFPTFDPAQGNMATRAASGKVLGSLSDVMPEQIGRASCRVRVEREARDGC